MVDHMVTKGKVMSINEKGENDQIESAKKKKGGQYPRSPAHPETHHDVHSRCGTGDGGKLVPKKRNARKKSGGTTWLCLHT